MAASTVWTPQKLEQLVKLHRTPGMTQQAAARELGVSPATVQRRSRLLGLRWNGQNQDCVMTVKANNQERREALAAELLESGARLLRRLEGREFTDLVKGEYGAEQLRDMRIAPTRSAAALTQAISNLVNTAANLHKLNLLHNSTSALDDWLAYMTQNSDHAMEDAKQLTGRTDGRR